MRWCQLLGVLLLVFFLILFLELLLGVNFNQVTFVPVSSSLSPFPSLIVASCRYLASHLSSMVGATLVSYWSGSCRSRLYSSCRILSYGNSSNILYPKLTLFCVAATFDIYLAKFVNLLVQLVVSLYFIFSTL